MTTCARCGDCCENIWIPVSFETVQEQVEWYWTNLRPNIQADMFFILEHWTQIDGPHPENGRYRFSCDQFNPATRECMAHENRPPVCREFPWYGNEPNEWGLVGFDRCSFWHDVPQDQWPDGVIPLASLI